MRASSVANCQSALVVFVVVFFPSRDFFDQGFLCGNAAVEALG
jgi:hypothetical protein